MIALVFQVPPSPGSADDPRNRQKQRDRRRDFRRLLLFCAALAAVLLLLAWRFSVEVLPEVIQ